MTLRFVRLRLRRLIASDLPGARRRLMRLFVMLLLVVAGHTVAMMALEGLSAIDAVWLTLTSITTVGYGDFSAVTAWGRLATMGLIYFLGIWLLAQMASEYVDHRIDRRERMLRGRWRWKGMRDHLLIINTPTQDSDRYLSRLVEQIRATPKLADTPVQIATRHYPEGLPPALREQGVVHHQVDANGNVDLGAINLARARYVLVLAEDPNDPRSDSLTFDVLWRMQRHGTGEAYVIAECVLDENKDRFPTVGATAVIRPIRAYPELIARELAAPGTEQIIEELFTHQGETTHRYDVDIAGLTWAAVACALIRAGIGTPLGYVDRDGEVVTNPPPEQSVNARALILVVRQRGIAPAQAVRQALSDLPRA